MLRADQFHLPPSPASGCRFTFQWAVPGLYVGQKDYYISSRDKPPAFSARVCLQLKLLSFQPILPGRYNASELHRHRPTAGNTLCAAGSSSMQAPRRTPNSAILQSSFSEAHLGCCKKSRTSQSLSHGMPGQGG